MGGNVRKVLVYMMELAGKVEKLGELKEEFTALAEYPDSTISQAAANAIATL